VYAPDPGSFRDPTNRVLVEGERILRCLTDTALEDFEALSRSELFRRGIEAGRIVGTDRVDALPASLSDQGWVAALQHDRIPVVSYPYEWPFAMLKDAALLELDLALAALDEGLITKDATPYNVQFVGTRPVHIDIGSFEVHSAGEPWFGYKQFCEQFLNPLVLSACRGLPHQAAMRGSLRGISPTYCAASLRWRDLLRPSLFVHVGLHARASRKNATKSSRAVRAELKAAGFGPAVVAAQLRRLRRTVEGLEWAAASSAWSDYSDRAHYPSEDLRTKARFVQHVAGQRHRRQVLDLGANDGYFSELVRDSADLVIAVDQDALVIDRLYRRLRDRSEERILPLVLDLADLPGGLGWRGRERPAFTSRADPDFVLCLALVHHLVITEGIPIEEVVEFLAMMDADVVLEFPTPDDDMVQLLAQQKKDQRLVEDRYSRERFERAVADHFETAERLQVGTRLLLHLEPRSGGNAAHVEKAVKEPMS
jgi:hypothetical protein